MDLKPIRHIFVAIVCFGLISCVSLESFVAKDDYKGAANYCDSQQNTARESCYGRMAELFEEKRPWKSYEVYVQLGKETGNSTYYNRAGEIAAARLTPLDALQAWELSKNRNAMVKLIMERSIVKDHAKRGIQVKTLAEYAEKLKLPKALENLALITIERDPSTAADYYRKAGKKNEAVRIYLKLAEKSMKEERYADAGKHYTNAEAHLKAREAYLAESNRILTRHNHPYYKNVLKFYKLAGEETEGKKRVALHMIKKGKFKEGIRLAKSVDNAFQKQVLNLAGDMLIQRIPNKARDYFREAGNKDPDERIATFFLNLKNPDFRNAEKYFKQSRVTNHPYLLLAKAIEKGDSKRIQKYAAGASGPSMHEKIAFTLLDAGKYEQAYSYFKKSGNADGALLTARKADAHNKTVTAAKYYYLAGEKTQAVKLWRGFIEKSIKNQTFIQDYVTLKNPPKGLMEVYWKEILQYFDKGWKGLTSVPDRLKDRQPVLALGFIHNQHRADHFRRLALIHMEGKSDFSMATAKQYNQIGALHTQFNVILTTLVTEKGIDPQKHKKGFDELMQAQMSLLKKNYRSFVRQLDKAKKIFVN